MKRTIFLIGLTLAVASIAFGGGGQQAGRNNSSSKTVMTYEETQAAKEAAEQAKKDKEQQAAIDAANAAGVQPGDFTVGINKAGDGVIITAYKGSATIVVIPAEFEGFPVKEIMEGAFEKTPN
jgi:hypothetical protein